MVGETGLKRRLSLAFILFSAAALIGYAVVLVLNNSVIAGNGLRFWTSPINPVAISLVGCLLSYRRPENAVSWVLVLAGFLVHTVYLEAIVAILLLKGAEPSFWLVVASNSWSYLSGLVSTIAAFAFVIFPTGRLLSERWRFVYWLLVLQVVVSLGRGLYLAADLARDFDLASRGLLAIELTMLTATGPTSTTLHTRAIPEQAMVSAAIGAIALAVVVLGLASLTIRFRSGTPVERQQVKWLIFAMVFWAAAIVLILGPLQAPLFLFNLVLPLIVSAMAIAILRYRLYNIDIIINRTLVYGLLTACLAVLYFSSVLILQLVFQRVAGEQSPLALVASTLLIAVAFTPLRRRLQDFIDQRFYRRKYDAAETLNQFAAMTRVEVDLDAMSAALLRAVERSLQPRKASLWLRKK